MSRRVNALHWVISLLIFEGIHGISSSKVTNMTNDRVLYFSIFVNISSPPLGFTYTDLKQNGENIFDGTTGPFKDTPSFNIGIGLNFFPFKGIDILELIGFDGNTTTGSKPLSLTSEQCRNFEPQLNCIGSNTSVFPLSRSNYNLGGILKYHIYTIGKGQLTLWSGAGYHYAKGTTSSDAQLVLSSVNITMNDITVKSWYAKLAVGFEAPLYDWMNVIFSLGVEYRNRTVDLRPSQGNIIKNDFNFTLSGGLGFF